MTDNLYKIERKILYKELEPLFAALSSVRYAVVKGEVLSQQIYGVPDRRRSSDIDILIDKKNVKFLEEQLRKLGFEQKLPEDNAEIRRNRVLCMAYSHQIPSYHKDKFGFHLNVDVNYDIFWGEYEGKRCSIDEFLSDTVDMEIYGVTVKTLPIEKAFVQLVLHHYKEMNSIYHLSQYNCIRTHMFKDIKDMLELHKELLGPKTLEKLIGRYSIGTFFYYIVFFTSIVFPKDTALKNNLCVMQCYREDALIECFGLCSKERIKWEMPFEARLDNEDISTYVLDNLNEYSQKKITQNVYIFT